MKLLLSLGLLAATSACAQVTPAGYGPATDPYNENRMPNPPQANGSMDPMQTGSEERSNFFQMNTSFESGYVDNVEANSAAKPVNDETYGIRASFSLDQFTPRLHWDWRYSPAFTFYRKVTALNDGSQNFLMSGEYRLSRHTTLSFGDRFLKVNNVFGESYDLGPGAGGHADEVAPYSGQTSDNAHVTFTYQPTVSAQIGGGGTGSVYHFSNSSHSASNGLNDSHSEAISGFYSRHLNAILFAGLTYQYARIVSGPSQSENLIQTHGFTPYIQANLFHGLQLMVSVGPQHYSQSSFFSGSSWAVESQASASWQSSHTRFLVNLSRSVSGGGGFLGTYLFESVGGSVRRNLSKRWSANLGANYFRHMNLSSNSLPQNNDGQSVNGVAGIERIVTQHLTWSVKYQRAHYDYNRIKAFSTDPDVDRVSVSITYHFNRPLGR